MPERTGARAARARPVLAIFDQWIARHREQVDPRGPLDKAIDWQWFANETGLRWYTTFRSLIASAALHGLNAQEYLEQLLLLAPHWPVTRMIDLAPKYWAQTVAGLDARQRAILTRPWETADAVTEIAATLVRAA